MLWTSEPSLIKTKRCVYDDEILDGFIPSTCSISLKALARTLNFYVRWWRPSLASHYIYLQVKAAKTRLPLEHALDTNLVYNVSPLNYPGWYMYGISGNSCNSLQLYPILLSFVSQRLTLKSSKRNSEIRTGMAMDKSTCNPLTELTTKLRYYQHVRAANI